MPRAVTRPLRCRPELLLLACLLLLVAAGCDLWQHAPVNREATDAYRAFSTQFLEEDLGALREAVLLVGLTIEAYDGEAGDTQLRETSELLLEVAVTTQEQLQDREVPAAIYQTPAADDVPARVERLLNLSRQLTADGENLALELLSWLDNPDEAAHGGVQTAMNAYGETGAALFEAVVELDEYFGI